MATALETGRDVIEKALTWPEQARAAVVTDAATYSAAGELLKGIKALRAEVDATFDPIISAAYKSHRIACDQKKAAEAPLSDAERIIKRALVAYDDEQERIRREAQRRIEEEARRQTEAEAIERAAALEREGQAFGDTAMVEEAQQIIQEQISAPAPPVAMVPKATPKVAGIVHRTTWSAQVVSLIDLVKFVAANPSHVGLLQANLPALNAQARSLKGGLRLPGVRALETRDVAAGR